MNHCENCKFVLIHYDKNNNRTIRCYHDYIKSVAAAAKKPNPFKDVTNNPNGCEHYILDQNDESHRTYRVNKIFKEE